MEAMEGGRRGEKQERASQTKQTEKKARGGQRENWVPQVDVSFK